MDVDPKQFVARMYQPKATASELNTALQYAGFTEINIDFHPPHPNGDGYWSIICSRDGTAERVRQDFLEILQTFSLHPEGDTYFSELYPEKRISRHVSINLPGHVLEQTTEAARAIVNVLLDDIDADLPSHKSEVRILPTSDPRRFDVTLLTGFDPVYIGTLGHQGNVWKPVEVMPGVGREMRAKLHFVGPNKEDVAMAMVQTLRPIWKRKIAGHLTNQMESVEEIAKEAAKAEKPASPEQAEAGNYRKGHVNVQGLEIAIENAEGSTRSGTGKDGKTWKVTMPAHYGYIKGTQGKDKDHLDVYIGPKPDGLMVFVVNQQKEDTKGFDEHKIMLGFATKDEAIETYDRAFSGDLGPKLRQSVVSTTVDKLKEWIASGNTKKPFEAITESERPAVDGHVSGDGTVAYVDWIQVPRGQRRQGLGRGAYTEWERSLPATVKTIVLMAADAGDGPSDAFWQSLGFDYQHDGEDLDYESRQMMSKRRTAALVDSLIEADEENGFDALKRLALRAGQGAAPGTQFHIGFAIATSDEHMIEQRANDDALEVDWDAINAAIPIIERNAITVLGEQGIQCRSEGHDSTGDLVGSAWVEAGTGGVRIVQQFIDAGEPFSTGSGTIDFIQQGLATRLYQGVPENIAAFIDVDISFLAHEAMQNPDPLAEAEEIDPKALALRTTPIKDGHLTDIVQAAYDRILALPYDPDSHDSLMEVHREAAKIAHDMVTQLEQATGRRALNGTREMLKASARFPWDMPGQRTSRTYAREIVSSFRSCSKPVKQ